MNRRAILLVAIGTALAGCTIKRSVEPIGKRPLAAVVCIQQNDTVWKKEFLPWLAAEFRRHGFETNIYQGSLPENCRLHARYWATWGWELAVYLKYAIIRIFEEDDLIGYAAYDATAAWVNTGKFGATEDKLRPLIEELLHGVLPLQAVPPRVGKP